MGIAGDIFTAVAGIAAAWSALISRKQFKDQTQRQNDQERPRLVPLRQELFLSKSEEFVDMSLAYEWKLSPDGPRPTSEKSDPFSKFTFPIVNTGKTFAINVKVRYVLENGIDAVSEFKNHLSILRIINPKSKQLQVDTFSFDLKQKKTLSPEHEFIVDAFLVTPLEIGVPLIKSNESEHVRIPMYFTVLTNLYIEKLQSSKPRLRVYIDYQDEYNEPHTDIYRVEVKINKQNIYEHHEDYSLDFTKIKPNDKKAHP